MDFRLLTPGQFLSSADLAAPTVLTISDVKIELLEGDEKASDGKPISKPRGVVSFREDPRRWVMNKTNATCLSTLFGRETNAWIGRQVTLHAAPWFSPFTREHTTAIRVHGAPHLTEPLSVTIKMHKKADTVMVLQPTPKPKTSPWDDALALCKERSIPWQKMKTWMRDTFQVASTGAVKAEHVQAYLESLAAEPIPCEDVAT